MDVREKLIEILRKPIFPHELADPTEAVADYLLDSGVTVQDGKPLDAFLHPVDAYKGLKAKYLVFKADTGERVGNCFVLRPDKDHAAVEAIRAYARATDNETLAEDIYNWVGKGEPVKEWISVDDKLPPYNRDVLVYRPNMAMKFLVDNYEGYYGEDDDEWYEGWAKHGTDIHGNPVITHWAYLPKPPKGE